jgi:hypothetical protein
LKEIKIIVNVREKPVGNKGGGCVIDVSHPRVILMNSPRSKDASNNRQTHRDIHSSFYVYRPVTLIRGHLESVQNLTRITERYRVTRR